ncbi:unnamed protein product [Clonostachys rhizophaga]|uniref:N-acetyltransferase domain-containing protein n=1 Tax=Clonostachys rhizophaga TaxID=160324 RepID=A0A9N9VCL6_9HYPO|nr:unnamed protein product [Clonostachys rhizophaga]
MSFPVAPAFGALRLASLRDVPRIATVATAGFYYSPVFPWERRFHRDFPTDTFRSYEKMFADAIISPDYIALVVEDSYDPAEAEKTEATIKPDVKISSPKAGDPVIVGVATWKLQPNSTRRGQYITPEDSSAGGHGFDGSLGRDKSPFHADILDEKCDAAEEKYFKGHQLVDMVVVHPAYWRRGHGTLLVKWGKALAEIDRVVQGVIAADMGEKLYTCLGYGKLDDVRAVSQDGPPPHEVRVGVLRYSGPWSATAEL